MNEYALVSAGFRTDVAVLRGPLLLRQVGAPSLAAHRRLWPEPVDPGDLVATAARARLSGRGGAQFPLATKLAAALRSGRGRELVVNAAESEPASAKDGALLITAPHLVLDGAELAAGALGVRTVHLVVPQDRPAVIEAAMKAVRERLGRHALTIEVHPTTGGFVGGQARAVLELLAGRENLPVTAWQPEAVAGLRGRPTLLSNAETFAQLAAAHADPAGYAALGTAAEPGTRLLSVAADGPGGVVLEVRHGEPLAEVLALCGYDDAQPVLVGGYHGNWLSSEQLRYARVSPAGLGALGARMGAGVLLPLLPGDCPVGYTAQIAAYLAQRRARRCGPCTQGLPALAEACERLAAPDPVRSVVPRLRELATLVTGRGACAHPDGTARLVLSMLATFPAEVAAHEEGECLAGVRTG